MLQFWDYPSSNESKGIFNVSKLVIQYAIYKLTHICVEKIHTKSKINTSCLSLHQRPWSNNHQECLHSNPPRPELQQNQQPLLHIRDHAKVKKAVTSCSHSLYKPAENESEQKSEYRLNSTSQWLHVAAENSSRGSALHQLYSGTQCLLTSIKSRLCQHYSPETGRERGWGEVGKSTLVTHTVCCFNVTHATRTVLTCFCMTTNPQPIYRTVHF